MKQNALDRLRAICLALPEAVEAGGVGDPSFKVREKIFAHPAPRGTRHGAEGRPYMWCKAPPGAQQALVGAEPGRFFVPPYVGCHGWVGMWLDIEIDWDEVADLVEESYRMTAPKHLWKQL
jgi:hypothetical protein